MLRKMGHTNIVSPNVLNVRKVGTVCRSVFSRLSSLSGEAAGVRSKRSAQGSPGNERHGAMKYDGGWQRR